MHTGCMQCDPSKEAAGSVALLIPLPAQLNQDLQIISTKEEGMYTVHVMFGILCASHK